MKTRASGAEEAAHPETSPDRLRLDGADLRFRGQGSRPELPPLFGVPCIKRDEPGEAVHFGLWLGSGLRGFDPHPRPPLPAQTAEDPAEDRVCLGGVANRQIPPRVSQGLGQGFILATED